MGVGTAAQALMLGISQCIISTKEAPTYVELVTWKRRIPNTWSRSWGGWAPLVACSSPYHIIRFGWNCVQATTNIIIDNVPKGHGSIAIYNIYGQLFFTTEHINESITINVENWPTGQYVIWINQRPMQLLNVIHWFLRPILQNVYKETLGRKLQRVSSFIASQ